MLSGIGPKWHLDQLGIPVLADLPVGENLQDHYGTGAIFNIFKMAKNLNFCMKKKCKKFPFLQFSQTIKNSNFSNKALLKMNYEMKFHEIFV